MVTNCIRKMSKLKKTSVFFLLFLLPVFFSHAQPQSFYFSSGQTIQNGTVARGYCLEYSKDVLRISNIAELTKITGSVTVVYKNGGQQTIALQELLQSGRIGFIPLDSYERLQFIFRDESIAQIITGSDGLGLFRQKLTAYEDELTQKNIQKIIEMEAQGKSHSEIQAAIWRTRIEKRNSEVPGKLTIDWQTTENEAAKVSHTFDKSPTVSYGRDGRTFMRIDGLLTNNEVNEYIIELITHYHSDHISRSVVEQCIRDGNFGRIIAPQSALDVSRNRVFSIIAENAGIREYNLRQENRILEITPDGIPLNRNVTATVGDFKYSKFDTPNNTSIEIYKYQKAHNANSDGLIYRLTHKNVSTLVLGDFDDVTGLENLLEESAKNEVAYFKIAEEISKLRIQQIEAYYDAEELARVTLRITQMPGDSPEAIAAKQQAITEFFTSITQTGKQENIVAELEAKIRVLNEKMTSLPFLKADVIKWPHHAHIFPDTEKADSVIKKLNEVLDPQHIIWQVHTTQDGEKFEDYIKRFDFWKKFMRSDKLEINFLSILERLNTRRPS